METTNLLAVAPEETLFNTELWSKILKLNLALVRDRMIIKYAWAEQRTDEAISAYRQYLYLTQVYGRPIAPTSDVDEIWHQHILHTNKYAIDCKTVFGRFLHHLPTPSKWKQAQTQQGNCQSPCCNHQDCCNDNPSKTLVTINGTLAHADCGEPAPGGCAPIGGSDDYCSGTTSDSFTNKAIDFDNPDMSTVTEAILFKDIVGKYFSN